MCDNNDQKFTQVYNYAAESKESLEQQGVSCYIEDTWYGGELYYVVRRTEDNKILKLKNHVSPDISKYIPKEYK
ncbi:hypothetical protein D3C80_2108940 [compost metagenome]